MGKQEAKNDRLVTQATTRLFWDALFQTKVKFWVSSIGHSTNFFINGVLVPLLIAYAVQDIIKGNFDTVTSYAFGILGVALFAGAIQYIAVWTFNRAGTTGVAYVSRRMFSNYLAKDYEFFGNNFVGSLGSHITTTKKAFLDYQLLIGFNGPRIAVTIVASLIVVWIQAPLLALVIVASMLANISFIFFFSRYRLQFRKAVSEASSKVAGVVGDAMSHGTTVKSYASETYEQKRLDSAMGGYVRAQLKSWDLFIPAAFMRNMISVITVAVLLVVSARLYEQGKISIAIIALVQLYVVRLMNTMIEVGELIKAYDQLMGDAHIPVATMLLPTTVHDPQHAQVVELPIRSVKFEDVTYQYPDAKTSLTAIENLSLSVSSGQKIGIVGYSGSGKSTLTKLLLRFMDVNKGAISVNGVDIRSMSQAQLRSVISYVPQEPLLFHRSIADNILYATESKDRQDMLKAADLAYVTEFVDDLPDKYETLVGERGVKLSGGQRQRVAIARAILKDAPILVLDEATSALDSRSEQLIQKALWKLMERRTAIVIAHRLSTIQKMDKIVVMDKGKIVQTGTHTELLADKTGIYAALWAHQSGGYLGGNDDEQNNNVSAEVSGV